MINKNKSSLRKELISKRRNVSDKAKKDSEILNRFMYSDLYKSCDVLMPYVSHGFEISTVALIEDALSKGKTVAVPLCNPEDCTMNFYVISSLSQLRKGSYGIFEPDSDKCEELISTDNALCVVPGLAFDRKGFRIGFGKGYYDRYLSSFHGATVGLCYNSFLEESLLKDEYDKSVAFVVTESKIYNTCQGE